MASDASLTSRMAFLFLSPCPQRTLLGAIDLLAALVVVVHARLLFGSRGSREAQEEPLLRKPTTAAVAQRRSFRHRLALAASTALAASSPVLLALAVLLLPRATWLSVQCAFLVAQFLAHLAAAGTVAAEKATATRAHPVHLRLFWLGTAALGALFSGSVVARYAVSIVVRSSRR